MQKIDKNKLLTPYEIVNLYLFKKAYNYIERGDIDRFIPLEKDIDMWNYFVDNFNKDVTNNKDRYIKRIIWGEDKKTDVEIRRLTDSAKFEEYINEEFKKCGIDIGFYYYKEQYLGENKFGIEIKNDKVLKNTGNIYIEYQERHRLGEEWNNSGILKEDNSKYWLIGDIDYYLIILKETLVDIFNNKQYDDLKETPTSRGFVLNIKKHKDIILATKVKNFIEEYGVEL